MSELVSTRRRLTLSQRFSVPKLLTALGVEFRRGDFWEANKFILRELYAEAQSEVRDRIKELHPDRPGGDSEAVRLLIAHWRQAQKAFAIHLPPQINETPTIRIVPVGESVFEKRERAKASQRKRSKAFHERKKNDPSYRASRLANTLRWEKRNRDKIRAKAKRYRQRKKNRMESLKLAA